MRTSESRDTSSSLVLVPLRTRSSQPDSQDGLCELRVWGTRAHLRHRLTSGASFPLQRRRSYVILVALRILFCMAGEPVMPRVVRIAAAAAAILLWLTSDRALADILVQVNKASQRMSVIVDGEHRYTWAVSTGVGGTPSGT